MVSYKLRKGKEKIIISAIKEFVDNVHKFEPETIYTAHREIESDRFVHFMKFPDTEAKQKHAKADYTERFVKTLFQNCREEPKFSTLKIIE